MTDYTAILFLDEVRHIDVSDRMAMVGVKSQVPPPKKKDKAPSTTRRLGRYRAANIITITYVRLRLSSPARFAPVPAALLGHGARGLCSGDPKAKKRSTRLGVRRSPGV